MTARMGELGVANPKGNVPSNEARVGFVPGWKSCSPPDLASIGAECLSAAEAAAAEHVLNFVRPTLDSEEKRRDVIDYLQQLVKTRLNCEVVSYGSVPLKTYLPDGDIDLTVLKGPNAVESLAHAVVALFQSEERNENAEFRVKETQFIDAEVVKLVKCFVGNFVIDLSFNQLGGLSALCFLEQVDRFIGRDHLFKRSILLIKTWCYYESRVLGAHHGLLSTYALEILILYIFHHFHSSLTGPLSALYKFLDYYSQFDWENYCISLRGRVCKASLPDIVAMLPEGGMNPPLLGEEFLEHCLELFSVCSMGLDANSPAFHPKHLNIIDPLKENNNLGRSVHRGNFYRILSAFKFGAHKLGQLLLRPTREVSGEICNFFANTRSRHESQCIGGGVAHLTFDFDHEDSFTESLSSQVELFSEGNDMPDFEARNDGVHKHIVAREVPLSSPEMPSDASLSSDRVFVGGCRLSGGSDKFGSVSVEMKATHLWCLDNSDAATYFDFRETDVEGEREALNPLADLSGDYDGNIRSLLRGQLSRRFSSNLSGGTHLLFSPPGFQNRKPWDVVRQSIPLKVNNNNNNNNYNNYLSAMNSRIISADYTLYPGPNPRDSTNAFYFDGKPKARGTGTYFPNTNVVGIERSSYGRGKNKVSGNENRFHWNGTYPAGETNVEKRYYRRMRRSDVGARSDCSGEGGNRDEDSCFGALRRIEFGSFGNFCEKVIPRLATQGSSAVLIGQRVAGESIHLKNEDEFPPLCQ